MKRAAEKAKREAKNNAKKHAYDKLKEEKEVAAKVCLWFFHISLKYIAKYALSHSSHNIPAFYVVSSWEYDISFYFLLKFYHTLI